jgi:hypothetical protein
MMQSVMLDVFGRGVLVVKTGDGWQAFFPENEGKHRPA